MEEERSESARIRPDLSLFRLSELLGDKDYDSCTCKGDHEQGRRYEYIIEERRLDEEQQSAGKT